VGFVPDLRGGTNQQIYTRESYNKSWYKNPMAHRASVGEAVNTQIAIKVGEELVAGIGRE
jgi:hypothetical protein